MRIHCPQCRRVIAVPDDKAQNPALKVKCAGCGTVFAFAQASLALQEPVPRPAAPAPAPARPAAPRPAAPPPVPRAPAGPAALRRCANHPQARAESVCPQCRKGWCSACGKQVQSAVICPACEGLCRPASDYQESLEKDRRRARPLGEELGTILSYPFVDKVAYVMLALVTWFFGLLRGFGGFAFLLSDGLLMAYSFSAVSKVSGGNLKQYMPDFRDISDLVDPLRLGLAALIVSWAPLIGLGFFVAMPSFLAPLAESAPAAVVYAQEQPPPAEEEAKEEPEETPAPEEGAPAEEREVVEPPERQPAWVLPAIALAAFWKIAYTPVALAVAALTRSFFQTLNPLVGIGTILRMGSTYWAAAAVYTVIVAFQWGTGFGLGAIPVPVAGGLAKAFVDAWAYLAIGCTLGLAVFKKARELELE